MMPSRHEDSLARNYAESFVRFLPRRAVMIARPARVRMRARKPCTFARRRLLGWKVRLLIVQDSVTLWYESPGFTTQGKSAFGQAEKELLPIQGTYFTPILIPRQSRALKSYVQGELSLWIMCV